MQISIPFMIIVPGKKLKEVDKQEQFTSFAGQGIS
jgi:hypothetical protein